MSRFTERWSTEQKAALIAAVCDRGLAAYSATKLANAGELEDGLAAFPIPYSTVLDITNAEKKRRQVETIKHAGPAAALDEVAAMMTREVAEQAAKLAKRRKRPTWNEWREAARAVNEVRKLLSAPTTPSPSSGDTEDARDGAQRAEPTPELVAKLRKRQREDFRRARADSSGDQDETPAAAVAGSSGRLDAGL